MNADDLRFDQVQAELLASIPELREPIESVFGTDYDLTKETPGEYPIFEDVVKEFLFQNLISSKNPDLLRLLFDFFERMASSNDKNVRDLLGIAILESLVYSHEHYQLSRRYLGINTAEFAELEEQAQASRRPRTL